MNVRVKILLSALVLASSVFVGRSDAQQPGRYIVTIQAPAEKAAEAVMRAGGAVVHVYDIIPAIAIQIPAQALPGLMRNPLVVAIEPDAVATTLVKPGKTPPSAPSESLPWGVDRIDAEVAWPTVTGLGVKVAVIDTGIDYSHPDLYGQVVGGIDYVNRDDDPMDDNGHGTHVAGIIGAVDNEIGVIGVAPGASLYAVKVLNRRGSGWISDIIAGVNWCVVNDIQIANMSLGSNTDVQSFHDACDKARDAGVLLVAAAGNDGGAVDYPAAYGSVIAVSATDISDKLPSWSSRGPQVDFAAPGVSIYSTYKGGGYTALSGTSMAAPHVAGTLALAAELSLTGWDSSAAAAVWELVRSTADDLGATGFDSLYGNGLVDAGEIADD